ncbi:MAG: AraC family transcriptional regulator ligand-binding domain-containing protein [Gammaproteobacteria bacterium]
MALLDDFPALGLHMGEQTSPSNLGLLGHLLMSAPTARGCDPSVDALSPAGK